MKRSAADAGAITDDAVAHAKRRLHQIPMLQRMPGAWPEDDIEDNTGEYVYTPLSASYAPAELPALAPLALAVVCNIISALNPLRLFRRRVVTPPRKPMLKLMRLPPSPSPALFTSPAKTQDVKLLDTSTLRRDSFASHFDLPSTLAITPTPQRRTSEFQASKLRTPEVQASGLRLSEASAYKLQVSETQASGLQLPEAKAYELPTSESSTPVPFTPEPSTPELRAQEQGRAWLQTPEHLIAEPGSPSPSADTPLPRSRLATPISHHVTAPLTSNTPAKSWPPRPATPQTVRSVGSFHYTPLETPISKLNLKQGDQKPTAPADRVIRIPRIPRRCNGQTITLSETYKKTYEKAALVASQKPYGWGNGGFDPQEIITTPVRTRAQRSPNSARRWSPYHYEHGVTRQKQSILRSAKPGYKPFEPTFNVPSPKKYVADDFHGIDDDGDNGMFDADGLFVYKESKVKISDQKPSWITGEPLDTVQGVQKRFLKTLGINEPYGDAFKHYRDPTQELQTYDPDESFLETPKPLGFDQQEMSPSKDYPEAVDEDDFGTSWYKKLAGMQPDFEEGVSDELKARYSGVLAQRRREQFLEDARARYAIVEAERAVKQAREAREQAIRDAEAARRRAEEERLAAEQLRDAEKRAIVMEMIEFNIKTSQSNAGGRRTRSEELAAEGRRRKRELQPVGHSDNPRDNPKVAAMLDVTDQLQDVSEKLRINRRDLGKLCPANYEDPQSGWLNDNVVTELLKSAVDCANAQLGHNTKQSDTAAPYVAFHSGWLEKVGDGSGIARWASKRGVNVNGLKLRDARKLFFPVCLHNHWTMVIVDPRKGVIETMNSMGGHDYYVVKKIKAWLRFELKDHYMDTEWITMPGVSNQQDNACDCGVFSIMNALGRIQGVPTWAIRAQVCAGTMGQCRAWLAGVVANGGFDPSGEFGLGVEEDCYKGENPNGDPDWVI